jgi:hypothetical protein
MKLRPPRGCRRRINRCPPPQGCQQARKGADAATLGRSSFEFRWLRRRQEARRLAQTDAEALIRDHGLGPAAYSAGRRREHQASSDAMARHWRRVALAIARKTGKRDGVDTATRMLEQSDGVADP